MNIALEEAKNKEVQTADPDITELPDADLENVAGGYKDFDDIAATRKCPNCGEECGWFSRGATGSVITAEYVCNKCGTRFKTWNNEPDQYQIF